MANEYRSKHTDFRNMALAEGSDDEGCVALRNLERQEAGKPDLNRYLSSIFCNNFNPISELNNLSNEIFTLNKH